MPPPRILRLVEHGPAVELELAPQERDALLDPAFGLELSPIPGTHDRWRVRATDRVGLLRTGHLTVEVRPKLPVGRILYLLGFASGLPELHTPEVDARQDTTLLEAMAWIYLATLHRALHRGLPHGYVPREEDTLSLRGRILFEEQLRRRPGTALPIAVRFDDFVEDTPLNRLLKSALRRLLLLPGIQPRTTIQLRRWLRIFSAVSDLPPGTRRARPTLTRLESHLESALTLALLILHSGSLEPTPGSTRTPAFLLDLSLLFERFIRESLRRSLHLHPRDFPAAGGGSLYLDQARTIALRPDLLWLHKGRPVFVGDVKYKHAGDGRGRRADLYQLLTYVTRLGLDRGLLVHASAQDPRLHVVPLAGVSLEVRGLDLGIELGQLQGQVDALTAATRQHAVQWVRLHPPRSVEPA